MNTNKLAKNNNLIKNIFLSIIFVILGAIVGTSFFGSNLTTPVLAEIQEQSQVEVSVDNETSTAGYLRYNWFNLTGLTKEDVKEIYFQTTTPETYVGSVEVGANDEQGTPYDGAASQVTAYWANHVDGGYTIYITCPSIIYAPKDSTSLFSDFTSLTNIDFTNLSTSLVLDMSSVFYNCSSLTSIDVSTFDTSTVQVMTRMFYGCKKLNSLDLSGFDMTGVTNVTYMLSNTTKLTEVIAPQNVSDRYPIALNKIFYNKTTKAGPYTKITSENDSASKDNSTTLGLGYTIATTLNDGTTVEQSDSFYLYSTTNAYTITLNEPTVLDGYTFSGWSISTNTTPKSSLSGNTLTIIAGATGNISITGILIQNAGYLRNDWFSLTGLTKTDVKEIYFQTTKPTGYESMTATSVGANNEGTAANNSQQAYDGSTCYDVTAYTTAHADGGYIVYITCPYTIYAPNNSSQLFYNYTALKTLNLTNFNTSKVTNMYCMFSGCKGLISLDVSKFDTSNVTDISYMFYYCDKLQNLNLSTFNTSNVIYMHEMFRYCFALKTINLSNWDTSKVVNMANMFWSCKSLQSLDLSHFDTSKVTGSAYGGYNGMNSMFNGCNSLTSLNISNWDTSNVVNMTDMFYGCSSLTSLDVSHFNTGKVTNMRNMFRSCSSLTSLDLSGFDMTNVTDVTNMLSVTTNLTEIVLPYNVSSSYPIDLGKNFYNKSTGAGPYTQITSTVCSTATVPVTLTRVFEISYDLSGGSVATDNPSTYTVGTSDQTITLTTPTKEGYNFEGWEIVTNTTPASTVSGNILTIPANAAGNIALKAVLLLPQGYLSSSYLTKLQTDVTDLTKSNVKEIYFQTTKPTGYESMTATSVGANNEGTSDSNSQQAYDGSTCYDVTAYTTAHADGGYIVYITCPYTIYAPQRCFNLFQGYTVLTTLNFANFNTSKVTDMGRMFYECKALTSLNLSNFDTSNVTGMAYMFWECNGLTSLEISNFNTSEVQYMSYMFYGCSNLTSLDVSNFDTSKVTSMGNMFTTCRKLTSLDVSNFDTKNVTVMSYMFQSCNALTSLDLSKWDTSKVQYMDGMFNSCIGIGSLNLSSFNTNQVMTMYVMFKGCDSLTSLNISNFSTENLKNTRQMFQGCSNLTSLDLSNFDMTNITDVTNMLYGTTSLTEIVAPKNVKADKPLILAKTYYNKSTGAGPYTQIDSTNCSTATVAVTLTTVFEISYDLNGGSVATDNPSTYTAGTSDQTITLTAPTKECYSFTGWEIVTNTTPASSINGNILTVAAGATGNIELKAIYTANTYTIKFNTDGGDVIANSSYTFNTSTQDITLTEPIKTGYTFTGWTFTTNTTPESSISGNTLTVVAGATGNIELKANYTTNGYTISFNTDGGSTITNSNYEFNESVQEITLTAPIKTGHTFTGWTFTTNTTPASSISGNILTVAEGATGDIELKAAYIQNAGYLRSDWFSLTGLTKTDIKEIYFQTTKPSGYESMSSISVAAKDINGTAFDGTTTDVIAYWIAHTDGGYIIYITCPYTVYAPKDSFKLFYNYTALTTLNLTNFDTSNVTNMYEIFRNCSSLTSLDVTKFVTTNVTNMSYMFYDCSGLTSLDLSNFDTGKVTTMEVMFFFCSSLTSLDLSNFDTGSVTDMSSMFYGCSGLTSLDVTNFDTSNVTDMSSIFRRCSSLTSLDISGLDTSQVTTMSSMFSDCSSLTSLDVTNFDTGSVTNMYSMFSGCSSLTSLDVTKFVTTNVTNMYSMFSGCSSLTSLDVTKFVTTNVTKMGYMFYDCSGLTNLDVSNFNTENATDMGFMFSGCELLTSLDVTNFDTSKVTTMPGMFSGCSSLTSLDVSSFNTSNVTKIASMFYGCSGLTSLDVSSFNTSNVTEMYQMFKDCSGLTSLDLSNFDTGKVTAMEFMFKNCSGLTSLDLSNFDTSQVTTMSDMFRSCSSLTSLDVSNFDTSQVTNMLAMFNGCSRLTSLDLSSFDMTKVTNVSSMLAGTTNLTEIVLPYNVKDSYKINLYKNFYNKSTGAGPHTQITSTVCSTATVPVTLTTVFEISYDLNGGSVATDNASTYTAGTSDQTITLTVPTKEGYSFTGWEIVTNTTIACSITNNTLTIPANATGDIRLKANFAEGYTITYNLDSGTVQTENASTYIVGTNAQEITLTAPTKTGYTFKEWIIVTNTTPESSVSGQTLTVAAGATGNIELKANYTTNDYTISFNTDGGSTVANSSYTFNTSTQDITLTEPTKNGYTFKQWSITTNTTPESSINGNILTVAAGATGNIELKAIYTANTYTITFDTDGADAYEDKNYTVSITSQNIDLPIPIKTGYIFKEWTFVTNSSPNSTISGNVLTVVANAFGEIELKATYTANTYTITFNTDGGNSITSLSYTFSKEEQTQTVFNAVKSGYTFKNWEITTNSNPESSISENILTIAASATGNIVLKAIYEIEDYKISYNTDGGESIKDGSYTYNINSHSIDLPVAIKKGYTFKAWTFVTNSTPACSINNNTLNVAAKAIGNIELKATYTINTYTIAINTDGGDEIEDKSYTFSTEAQSVDLGIATKRGYTFSNWEIISNSTPESTIEGTMLKITASATESIVVKAIYTANEYTITFDTDGGYSVKASSYTYSSTLQTIALPTPTKIGYTFESWQIIENTNPESNISDNNINIAGTAIGVIKLKATYIITTYTISFDTDGGDELEELSYTFNETQPQFINLPNAIKRGYDFVEWNFVKNSAPISSIDELLMTVPAGAINNIELIAVYQAKTFAIKLDTDGGDVLEDLSYTYSANAQTVALSIPFKKGYTFNEWVIVTNSDPESTVADNNLIVAATAIREIWLKATYTINTYTVTFDSDGGDGIEDQSYTFSTEAQTLNLVAPAKRGYSFANWMFIINSEPVSTIENLVLNIPANATGDITLKAVYTVNTYTIIFDVDGGREIANIEYTYNNLAQTKNLSIPTKEGYTFNEWVIISNTDPESAVQELVLTIAGTATGSIELKAIYTLKAFDINFNTDGGDALESLSYFYNEEVQDIELPVPTKTGHTFSYWTITGNSLPMSSVNGSILTVASKAMGNIVLKANYTVNTYAITFNSNGGTSAENTTYTFKLLTQRINLQTPTRKGHTFVSWSIISNSNPESKVENNVLIIPANAVNDIELEAIYDINKYDIVFNTDGGNNLESIKYAYMEKSQNIDLPIPEKRGYTFSAWTMVTNTEPISRVTGTKISIPAQATGDVELKATYTVNTYQIILDSDGGTSFENMQYSFSGSVQQRTLTNPTKRGHTFISWSIEINSDPKSVLQETSLLIPVEATGDITIKALYRVNTYKLTVDTDNGQLIQNLVYTYNDNIQDIELAEPARLGYTFTGWKIITNTSPASSIQGNTLKVADTAIGDISLIASYTINTYNITFDSNGGTSVANSKYTYSPQEQARTLSKPNKPGHIFGGWGISQNSLIASMITDNILTIPANATGDIALVAYYEPYTYTITIDSNGGTNLSNKTYGFATATQRIALDSPTKPDYTFTHWVITANSQPASSIVDNVLVIPANAIGNITIFANFKVSTYTISFDTSGGKDLVDQKYAISSEHQTIQVEQPYKAGYVFSHWIIVTNASQDCTIYKNILSIPANTEGDILLKAVYLVESYTISFNTDGGSLIANTSYTKSGNETRITLQTPTKNDSTFEGWEITINSNEPAAIESGVLIIPANAYGEIVLTAVWVQRFVVTFDLNIEDQYGIKVKNPPQLQENQMNVVYGTPYGYLPELKADGYEFKGWYLDKECTIKVEIRTIVKTQKDHTLYAKWIKPAKEVTLVQIILIIVIIVVAIAFVVVVYVWIYKK